eukprot:1022014-Pyramimonas_sp.AAC.1
METDALALSRAPLSPPSSPSPQGQGKVLQGQALLRPIEHLLVGELVDPGVGGRILARYQGAISSCAEGGSRGSTAAGE